MENVVKSGRAYFVTTMIGLLALPRAAGAFEPESPACFATAPVWNAVPGALVSGITPGPVAAVINGVGESRTHVMISNGDWATHSTTRQASVRTVSIKVGICPACVEVGQGPDTAMPLKPTELAAGSPGFTQINMGGAYAYWSTATRTWRQSIVTTQEEKDDPSLCGDRCKVEGTASWLWASAPYQVVWAQGGSDTFFYGLGSASSSGAFSPFSYGFKQYMDGSSRVRLGTGGESSSMRGIVCSQVPAYAYKKWVTAEKPNIPANTGALNVRSYTHDETANAGYALWHSVYGACMGTDPGFWGDLANTITGLFNGSNVQETTCNHAAWQVLNCFFQGEDPNGGGCKSTASSPWNTFVADASKAGAKTLSADQIMGVGIRAGNTRLDAGPWVNWRQFALQWNGGGSTYGCYY